MIHYWLIVILVVLVILLIVQLLVRFEILSANARFVVGVVLLFVAICIGVFTSMQDKNESYIRQLSEVFLQGRNITCKLNGDNIDVNNTKFNFVSGTLSVIGKEGEYYKVNIPLKNCHKE